MNNNNGKDLQGTPLEKINNHNEVATKTPRKNISRQIVKSSGAGTPLEVSSHFENIEDKKITRSGNTEGLQKAMQALKKAKTGNFLEEETNQNNNAKQNQARKQRQKQNRNKKKQTETAEVAVQNVQNTQNTQTQTAQKPKQNKKPKQKNKPAVQNTEAKPVVANEKSQPNKKAKTPKNQPSNQKVQETAKATKSSSQRKRGSQKSKGEAVKIHFIGGIGEIGKNCTAIECGDDIIVVDGGMSFPTEEMPGIDVVIPDVSFLVENREKVRGFLITHGHEDHIGALPYILKDIKAPLYASKLTFAILENKLKEKNVSAQTNIVSGGSVITLGKFKIEFIHMNHSIPGSLALSISTPQGVIFHTGDFKIDLSPVDGEVCDLARIAEIGKKGVQVLLADSTNADKEGYVMSESTVGSSLLKLFEDNASSRIIVATFASNVHRVQQIIDVAKKTKRKVALSGRSMINVAEAAMKIGAIKADPDTFVDIDKIGKLFDHELVIISTGSQGEPMSALSRMATGDFNKVKITDNDTVIISASPIPGNEKMVYRTVNRLMKLGANVIYSKLHEIHVSGHAAKEELKIIHQLVNPELFIPVHGEYRHLISHKKLAMGQGMAEGKILVPELGDSIEITPQALKRVGQIPSGAVLVDGLGFGDMDSIMLKDRKLLAEEGVMIAVVAINTVSGELLDDPELVIRGIGLAGSKDQVLMEAKKIIMQIIKDHDLKNEQSRSEIKHEIRKKLRSFFLRHKQRPMILPIVIEAGGDITISKNDIRIDGV